MTYLDTMIYLFQFQHDDHRDEFKSTSKIITVWVISGILLLICLMTFGISLYNMFRQRSKPIIFTFYCFTIFATGIASAIFIYSIIWPNDIFSYDKDFILDNLSYQRFFGTLVYISLLGVYFIIGVSMV